MAAQAPLSDNASPAVDRILRRETFLARYTRGFKLGMASLLLVTAAAVVHATIVVHHRHTPKLTPVTTHKIAREGQSTQSSPENASANNYDEAGNLPALNSQDEHSLKLTPAPDPALTDDSELGSLPKIASDGRQPWQVYARPFDLADKRPRIAIVIVGLGMARGNSDAATTQLPTNITLAFDAQSPVVGAWLNRARQDGHEVLLSVPMEPFDFPQSDPGPNTLLTTLSNGDNLHRLTQSLRSGSGYVGITTLSGSRFTDNPEKLKPVLQALKERGLMMFDAHVAPNSVVGGIAGELHIPVVTSNARIDDTLTPAAIDQMLAQLEQTARSDGRAVGIAAASPLVLDRLQNWLKDLPKRGIALAPVSALAQP